MEKYAKNISADFFIIDKRKYVDLPIPLEKFQIFDCCENYEWTIFLDADCLINPKSFNLTSIVENDVVIVSEYLNITQSKDPQFQTHLKNNVILDFHAPFYFLAFHKKNKSIVKLPYNPLEYLRYVNTTKKMKQRGIDKKWHLDELFLSYNVVKNGISTISLKQDLPNYCIAHNGNYLSENEKINFINENLETLNSNNILKEYV